MWLMISMLLINMCCVKEKKKPAECIEMTVWSRWFPPGNSDFSPVLDNLQQVSHEQKFGNASLCHRKTSLWCCTFSLGEGADVWALNMLPEHNSFFLFFILIKNWFGYYRPMRESLTVSLAICVTDIWSLKSPFSLKEYSFKNVIICNCAIK